MAPTPLTIEAHDARLGRQIGHRLFKPLPGAGRVFLSADDVAAFVRRGGAAIKGEPWRPLPDESRVAWSAREDVLREATRRARDAIDNPSQKQFCGVLAIMWRQATGEPASAGTFEQYIIDRNNEKRGGARKAAKRR